MPPSRPISAKRRERFSLLLEAGTDGRRHPPPIILLGDAVAGRHTLVQRVIRLLVPMLCVGTHWTAAPRPRNRTSAVPMSYDNADAERPSSALRRGSVVTSDHNGLDEALSRPAHAPPLFPGQNARWECIPLQHRLPLAEESARRRRSRTGTVCPPVATATCNGAFFLGITLSMALSKL